MEMESISKQSSLCNIRLRGLIYVATTYHMCLICSESSVIRQLSSHMCVLVVVPSCFQIYLHVP